MLTIDYSSILSHRGLIRYDLQKAQGYEISGEKAEYHKPGDEPWILLLQPSIQRASA